ncbi:MAG: DMT family transporter [Pseudomonadota bacterium]
MALRARCPILHKQAMETWVLITIGAAFFQNIRSGLQKHLRGTVGTAAATFVRFGFGLPFAFVFLWIALGYTGHSVPSLPASFWGWVMVGAICQILGQVLLVIMFTLKNFAVGGAYVRVEPVLAAVFGALLLAEWPSALLMAAVAISVIGVMLISLTGTKVSLATLIGSLGTRAAMTGIACASIFGLAAVAFRAASLSLGGPTFFVQGAVTLCAAITIQTIIMGAWVAIKAPKDLLELLRRWKASIAVGFVGAAASYGWFTAMTLETAAAVKAVAQVEMLFGIITAAVVFRERVTPRELIGCALIVSGVLLLILLG